MIGNTTINKLYREKLSRSLLLFAIIPTILVTGVFFQLFFMIINEISDRELTSQNKELSSFLSSEITSYKKEIQALQEDPRLSRVFQTDDVHNDIYKELYQVVTDHQLKSNFYIVDVEGDILLTNAYRDNTAQIYYDKYLTKVNKNQDKDITFYNEKDNHAADFTFLKMTAPIYDGNKVSGFIIFDLQSNQLRRFYENMNYTDIVITDPFGNQLFSSKRSLILDNGKIGVLSMKGYHTVSSSIVKDEFIVHSIRYEGLLQKGFFFGFLGLFVICGLMVIITRLFAISIARKKTKSIDTLLSTIQDVNEGRYKGYHQLEEEDEFETINYYLHDMILSKNLLLSENKEIHIRKTEAEIKQLQMQFNPHFLFNTLENIKFMIRMNPSSAEELLLKLSSILRYSIDNTDQDSPLKDDIKYIYDYLDIQKARFEERLNFSVEIPEELGTTPIPKLIMQPLVENAVKYGIDHVDHLLIKIKASRIGDKLLIMISDTGSGFSQSRLQEIRDLLHTTQNPSNHIGIYNVHRRIQLKYGRSYGVRVFSEENKGSLLLITIPYREEE